MKKRYQGGILKDITERIQELEDDISTFTERLVEIEERNHSGIEEPDMLRKFVLTLTNSDRLTEEEANRILERVF